MTNTLRIGNVLIKKDSKGLIYFLPQNFDGESFRKFKELHKNQISEFKKNNPLKNYKL